MKHLAPGSSAKSVALRSMVRQSFRASKDLTDETQIAVKKADAIRALSNYLVYQSAQTDDRLQSAMKSQQKQQPSNPPPTSNLPRKDDGNEKWTRKASSNKDSFNSRYTQWHFSLWASQLKLWICAIAIFSTIKKKWYGRHAERHMHDAKSCLKTGYCWLPLAFCSRPNR